MHTFRSVRTAAVSVVAGGVVLGVVGSASAASGPLSERFAGRAGAQVAEVSLFGRSTTFGSAVSESSLDAAGGQLSAAATGVGTGLAPETRSVARFGDPGAAGGTSCATPRLGDVLSRARSGVPATGAPVPEVEIAPACGSSSVTGTPSAFTAESSGGRTGLTVRLPDALRSMVGAIGGQFPPETLATPVGDLVKVGTPGTAQAAQLVGMLNGVLGRIAPGVALPAMEPRQTVTTLLQRLGTGDLLHVDLASATARTAGDARAYLAEAVSQGGVIDVLPGFRGPDLPPLLRITIAPSRAAVPVDRASTTAAPVVLNPLVRIESDLLGALPVAGSPVVEVGPGQSLSVLCDGPMAALCSEIAVSPAKAPVSLPGGAARAEASTVTAHLFRGLDSLAPGTNPGTALAGPAAMKALADAPHGLTMGDVTGIPGIRLVAGGVVAEAGGARVLPAGITALAVTSAAAAVAAPADPAPPAGNLPHTGGAPFSPAAAPALVGASVALGSLSRRRRRV